MKTNKSKQKPKQRIGMEGTQEVERKEEGGKGRGDEENRVEGAAALAPASPAHGGNQAEGHDPRPPAPTLVLRGAENSAASTAPSETVRPAPEPPVEPVEPSTATASASGSVDGHRSKTRPGPRSYKEVTVKGKEDRKDVRSGSRSRNEKEEDEGKKDDGRENGNKKEEDEGKEDDGKENRKRRRETRRKETGTGNPGPLCPWPVDSPGPSHPWPVDCDTTDDMEGMEDLEQEEPMLTDDSETDTGTLSEVPNTPVGPGKARTETLAGCSTASAPPTVDTTKRRGRGHPPTTYEYVGLAAAKREAAEAEERLLMAEVEKEVRKSGISRLRKQRKERPEGGETGPPTSPPGPIGPRDATRRSMADLSRGIAIASGTIEMVATRSKNLKGTFIKELKESAKETREVFAEVKRRMRTTGDVPGLQQENAALRMEVERLRDELRELRAIVEAMGLLRCLPDPASQGGPSSASGASAPAGGRPGATDQGASASRMATVDSTPPLTPALSRSVSAMSVTGGSVGRKRRVTSAVSSSDDSVGGTRGSRKKKKGGAGNGVSPPVERRVVPPPSPAEARGGPPPLGGNRPSPRGGRKAAEPPSGSNDVLLAQIASMIDAKLGEFRAGMGVAAGAMRAQTAPRPGPSRATGVAGSRGDCATAPPRAVPSSAGGRGRETPVGLTAPPPQEKGKGKRGGGEGLAPSPRGNRSPRLRAGPPPRRLFRRPRPRPPLLRGRRGWRW